MQKKIGQRPRVVPVIEVLTNLSPHLDHSHPRRLTTVTYCTDRTGPSFFRIFYSCSCFCIAETLLRSDTTSRRITALLACGKDRRRPQAAVARTLNRASVDCFQKMP